jgi:hypothetical protein
MAMGETLSHLEHLVQQGEVVKVDDGAYTRYLRA